MQQTTKPLNRDTIKYMAVFTMLLNHIAQSLMPTESIWTTIFTDVGWFTAITMCYFLVEGYFYTRSKPRYALRLFVFGVVSQLPYMKTFGMTPDFFVFNMMFSLLLCLALCCVKVQITRAWLRRLLIVVIFIASLFCDWQFMAPMFTLLFLWARGSRRRLKIAFVISMLVFGALNLADNLWMYSLGQSLLYTLGAVAGMALAVVTILYLYNGKRAARGRTFSKWFFYLFYPGHLLVLWGIRVWLGI